MQKILAVVSVLLLSVAVQAKEYLIESTHIPMRVIEKVANEVKSNKMTDPVLFMEVYSIHSGDILLRSDGQDFGGNKTDFDFGKSGNIVDISEKDFPLAIRILIGPQKGIERTARGLASGGAGALIGGIIGGIGAGICTGGLGGPAGAAIGAAIGGAIGGTAGAVVPVSDAKEVISFRFDSESSFVGTQKKTMNDDILSDGQEATITVTTK